MTGSFTSAMWQRFCPVGGITTELLGINATSVPPRLQVVVFPGNPGSAAYFKPFMLAVHRLLRGRADVLAVTHAGHDPDTDHGGRLWDLSEQVAHKVSYLREHVLVPGRAPVLLVGHSIGATMMFRAVSQIEGLDPPPHDPQHQHLSVKQQQQRPPILKLVAVFPFFETNFPGNWRQRRLRSLAPWYDYLGWLGAAVTSLPGPLRTAFVRLNAAMDPDPVELTCRLLSRHTVRNAFFLAMHEFKELSRPWDWSLLSALGPRVHVMGCTADTWLSRGQYEDLLARVPGVQATWHPDLRHAFCVSKRQSLAVAEIISAVARSIPDLNLNLDLDLDQAASTATGTCVGMMSGDPATAALPPATPAPGCCDVDTIRADIGGAADQAAVDDTTGGIATTALYGKIASDAAGGFREGAAAGFEWGVMRGAVKTLAALDSQAVGNRGLRDQIQALKAAADVDPRAAMLATFRHILSSPPTPPSHEQQDVPQQLPAISPEPAPSSRGPPPRRGTGHCSSHTLAGNSDGLAREPLSASAKDDPGVAPSNSSNSRGIRGASTDLEVEQLNGVRAAVAGMSLSSSSSAAVAPLSGQRGTIAAAAAAAGREAATAEVSTGGRLKAEYEAGEAFGCSRDAATLGISATPDAPPSPGRAGTDGAVKNAPDTAATASLSAIPAAPGPRGAGRPAVPIALPPDAAALHLPDMVALMGELRGRLADLGFRVESAAPSPPPPPPPPPRSPPPGTPQGAARPSPS
ncbi:hypothetical protein VOLCADRAFT_96604 [Volvox carteri f. nagariensis]|uniref:Uncharacterized protein n=1 Tax=Volvox carteri f. nagariensis TaxID=3068 RepID=D8UAJ7_VOLCA|nr:uncharacterized protein VOLCADRAFT_96604 [Volvox carteri f. nagariensis]EFJ43272.1 hypothetical protein VOLCADRAFT_96604 [Volvox carteri f. nagariensis]|eukprot:XP_002955632.1 hypothetical protein VOLCADRAFT_96604 [Volvox carteri f. nagariensis]